MLHITDKILLDENEIKFKFIRSPGPGGQHVNKAATGVQLRFDVHNSASLSARIRHRLNEFAKNRINSKGFLIITASRFRSQDLNRKDAQDRLFNLIKQAAQETKQRRRTKPTAASLKKRLETKKRRSKLKSARRSVDWRGE